MFVSLYLYISSYSYNNILERCAKLLLYFQFIILDLNFIIFYLKLILYLVMSAFHGQSFYISFTLCCIIYSFYVSLDFSLNKIFFIGIELNRLNQLYKSLSISFLVFKQIVYSPVRISFGQLNYDSFVRC